MVSRDLTRVLKEHLPAELSTNACLDHLQTSSPKTAQDLILPGQPVPSAATGFLSTKPSALVEMLGNTHPLTLKASTEVWLIDISAAWRQHPRPGTSKLGSCCFYFPRSTLSLWNSFGLNT